MTSSIEMAASAYHSPENESMEPWEFEARAIHRVGRTGLLLWMGFPVVLVASPFVAHATAEWIGGGLVGAYIVAVLLWLGFGARCSRCGYAIGRVSLKTGKDVERCPKCQLNHRV